MTSETIEALGKTETALAKVTLLAHPIGSAQLVVTSGVSYVVIGATLQQLVNGKLQPLVSYSSKLNSAQKNYSTYDRELLAVYEAIKHFRHCIEGRLLKIRTDYKPLISVLTKIGEGIA